MKITEFLQDIEGQFSMMRLQFLMACIASIWFGYLAISNESVIAERLSLSFMGIGFAGKALQRFAEEK